MTDPAILALEKARSGKGLSADDAYALGQIEADRFDELLATAAAVRDRRWPDQLTYSPKVFLPVTNLCRDRCTYCTFRRDPDEEGAWTMSPEEISDWSRRGRRLSCSEALMCLGDKPEIAFRGFKGFLESHDCSSTADYVGLACQLALDEGLLPHTNAGLLTGEEMEALRPLNVSMGLMLENISPRLRARGMPHAWAPDKEPGPRLAMLEEAGRLRIPFTTGILIGIGETEAERIASLLAIRELHLRYRHIQEVIVQNFRAKPDTPMSEAVEPGEDEMVRTVAIARLILGDTTSLQAPPNLSPRAHRRLIHAGINDWGGISPLTMDYVNPEAPWPHIERLRQTCLEEGFELVPRLPVYEDYMNEEFMDPAMLVAARGFGATKLEARAS